MDYPNQSLDTEPQTGVKEKILQYYHHNKRVSLIMVAAVGFLLLDLAIIVLRTNQFPLQIAAITQSIVGQNPNQNQSENTSNTNSSDSTAPNSPDDNNPNGQGNSALETGSAVSNTGSTQTIGSTQTQNGNSKSGSSTNGSAQTRTSTGSSGGSGNNNNGGSSNPSTQNPNPSPIPNPADITIVFEDDNGNQQTYNEPDIPPIPVTWGRYTNIQDGYSIDYPSNWQLVKIPFNGHEGVSLYPPGADINNQDTPYLGFGYSNSFTLPGTGGGSLAGAHMQQIFVDGLAGALYTNGPLGDSYIAAVFKFYSGYLGIGTNTSTSDFTYVYTHMLNSITFNR